MTQNTSHAVMSQRMEARDSADDFPTPPWATRALLHHVIGPEPVLGPLTCLEPACGAGHMAKVLKECFCSVVASDAFEYGFGTSRDFLCMPYPPASFDWVITNPPFRMAEQFAERALTVARQGVALLVRTVFLESVGRYERIFKLRPPAIIAQFVERVPMVKGRLDQKASTATSYAWLVWDAEFTAQSQLRWIPPCRKRLEQAGDYTTSRQPAPAVAGLGSC
jgi:hypothetical protein